MRNRFVRLTFALLMLGSPVPAAALAQNSTPAASDTVAVTFPNRVIDLSPDGKSVVAYDSSQLCVYDVATQKERTCADLAAKNIKLRPDDVVWSPDSTKIAFAEQAFTFLVDGDLWVMDAATGELTDLTDDGYAGKLLIGGDGNAALKGRTIYEDIVPAWSPDSRSIAFSRSKIVDGEQAGNDLAVISASGGEVRTIASVTPQLMGVLYYGIAWTPDGGSIAYSHLGLDPTDPSNGIWIVDTNGGTPKRVIDSDPKLGRPVILSINATGATGLIYYIEAAMKYGPSDGPVYALLNLNTGERTFVENPKDAPQSAFLGAATFSPDGSKLLFILKGGAGNDQLVIRDLATGADSVLFAGGDNLTMTAIGHGLDWTADGTVYTATDLNAGLLLYAETGAVPTPIPVPHLADATPSAAGPNYVAGDLVVTNDDTKLRVSPSTDASVAKSVPKDTTLQIVGASTAAGGFTWWPVLDPKTMAIGWVRGEFIDSSG